MLPWWSLLGMMSWYPLINSSNCISLCTPRFRYRYPNFEWVAMGLLPGYVKLRVAHAPGMLGTFSPPPWGSNPDKHHCTCVAYVPWCMPGSLTISFLWSRWRGNRSRHFRRMSKPQFYVSGKRPMSWQVGRGVGIAVQLYDHRTVCRIVNARKKRVEIYP